MTSDGNRDNAATLKVEDGTLTFSEGEMIAGMVKMKAGQLDSLIIRRSTLDFGSLELIVTSLIENEGVERVEIVNCHICDLWVAQEYLTKLIKDCVSLQSINLNGTNVDTDLLKAMASEITNNRSIREFEVGTSRDEEVLLMITSALEDNNRHRERMEEERRRREEEEEQKKRRAEQERQRENQRQQRPLISFVPSSTDDDNNEDVNDSLRNVHHSLPSTREEEQDQEQTTRHDIPLLPRMNSLKQRYYNRRSQQDHRRALLKEEEARQLQDGDDDDPPPTPVRSASKRQGNGNNLLDDEDGDFSNSTTTTAEVEVKTKVLLPRRMSEMGDDVPTPIANRTKNARPYTPAPTAPPERSQSLRQLQVQTPRLQRSQTDPVGR